jgi:hypothetical protein
MVIALSIIPLVIMLPTFSPFGLNQAQGQMSFSCPDGYQQNSFGLCEPLAIMNPNVLECPDRYIKSSSGDCELAEASSPMSNNTTNQIPNQMLNNTTNQNQNQTSLQPQQSPSQLQQLSTYEDPTNGIRIQTPTNWVIAPDEPLRIDEPGEIVEFSVPSTTSTTQPSFGSGPAPRDATLTISVQRVDSYLDTEVLQVKNTTLLDYVAKEKNEINSQTTPQDELGYRLEYLRDNQTTIGGNPAWKIEYMTIMSDRQILYNTEVYVLKGNLLYTLHFSIHPLRVPETLPIAEQIANSFQILS